MKKKLIFTVLLFFSINTMGQESYQVYLTHYVNSDTKSNPIRRLPHAPFIINVKEHSIQLPYNNDGFVLTLYQDNQTVYETYIPAGMTTCELPETLSGEYELQLSYGNYLYYGIINL